MPAAAQDLRGVSGSLERDGFTGLTVATGAGRFNLGPLWQLQVGQVWISDLFDEALLEQAPSLAELTTRATYIGLDGIVPFLPNLWGSVGARYEIDLLLGDRAAGMVLRGSVAGQWRGLTAGAAFERSAGSSALRSGEGTVIVGTALHSGPVAVGAGFETGRLWRVEQPRRALGVAAQLVLANALEFRIGGGTERTDLDGDWARYAAVGLGLRFGQAGMHVRYSGIGTGESEPLTASFAWTVHEPRGGR